MTSQKNFCIGGYVGGYVGEDIIIITVYMFFWCKIFKTGSIFIFFCCVFIIHYHNLEQWKIKLKPIQTILNQ